MCNGFLSAFKLGTFIMCLVSQLIIAIILLDATHYGHEMAKSSLRLCCADLPSVNQYIFHYRVRWNVPSFRLPCCFAQCVEKFKCSSSLKAWKLTLLAHCTDFCACMSHRWQYFEFKVGCVEWNKSSFRPLGGVLQRKSRHRSILMPLCKRFVGIFRLSHAVQKLFDFIKLAGNLAFGLQHWGFFGF
jgi:hypothetical protein